MSPAVTPDVPAVVRTVLGDVPAASLGATDYHEHLFQVSPLLPGDELDDEAASGTEAATLVEAGITGMVEATPTGLGRDPEAVARISRATGLAVVHVTGAHRQEHYPGEHWLCHDAHLTARFFDDVDHGLPAHDGPTRGAIARGPGGEPVRAGMVKAGIGYWRISTFERRVLHAAAVTARTTGVAVMVHLEHGSAAWEVLAALREDGLAAHRVVLAHADRNLDLGLHAELAAAGAYLGYDGPARHREAPDSAVIELIARMVELGHGEAVLLGGDVARRRRYRAYGGLPGLDYLPRRFLPRLLERIGPERTATILRDNPHRILTLLR